MRNQTPKYDLSGARRGCGVRKCKQRTPRSLPRTTANGAARSCVKTVHLSPTIWRDWQPSLVREAKAGQLTTLSSRPAHYWKLYNLSRGPMPRGCRCSAKGRAAFCQCVAVRGGSSKIKWTRRHGCKEERWFDQAQRGRLCLPNHAASLHAAAAVPWQSAAAAAVRDGNAACSARAAACLLSEQPPAPARQLQ